MKGPKVTVTTGAHFFVTTENREWNDHFLFYFATTSDFCAKMLNGMKSQFLVVPSVTSAVTHHPRDEGI